MVFSCCKFLAYQSFKTISFIQVFISDNLKNENMYLIHVLFDDAVRGYILKSRRPWFVVDPNTEALVPLVITETHKAKMTEYVYHKSENLLRIM